MQRTGIVNATSQSKPASRWRISRANAVKLFIAGFLILQVLIPATQLLGARPARFGWQMYSGTTEFGSYQARLSDGRIEPIAVNDYVARLRLEMDPAVIPAHLCTVLTDAAAIESRLTDDAPWQAHPCS